MLLALDIGNTSIKVGVFDGSADNMLTSFAISSLTERTDFEYALLIKQLLIENSVNTLSASCVISSVVPTLTARLTDACRKICNCEPFIIGSGTRTGFKIKIDLQSQLGADIVSNAAYAFTVCEPPFVIVDTGTATTVTAIDGDGQLIGAVIAPGATVSLEALNSSAALLCDVSLSRPDSVVGKNSQDSIRSGAYWGHVYMIDGFVRQLRSDLCCDGRVLGLVGTGGLCERLLIDCRNKFTLVPELTLRGAAALFYYNTTTRKK